jgi:hypothetical protein
MWKLYLTGVVVLVIAILANALASQIKVLTWYDFLTSLANEGTSGFGVVRWQDALWLFLVYPMILGAGAWAGFSLHHHLHD